MPAGEAVLVGVHEMMPTLGARVLERTRHHFGMAGQAAPRASAGGA